MTHGLAAPGGNSEAAHGGFVKHAGLMVLSLGSLGVVYGDIGTSPLYAFREAIVAAGGSTDTVSTEAVLSVLSLILWALILIVTVKYVLILLRADNNGEGGTLALMALAQRAVGKGTAIVFLLGVISAALFYGDAVITPAISVLSAIEGLKLATPAFDPYIVPLTMVILIALFAAQSKGTAKVAALFGPIMTVWFVAIALPGVYYIASNPGILRALSPIYGISFLVTHGKIGFATLGAVFLAVTGAEALYADLGHFGKRPIQLAWVVLVLPSLALNYLGQGAMVLANPKAIENPFFLLYPDWALLPMIALATMATIIASQAVITGAYSLSRQAIQLGLLPRLEIRHTSESLEGTDLYAARQRDAARCRRPSGSVVPVIGRARIRIRYRRIRDDGCYSNDDLHRGLARLALVAGRRRSADRAVPCHRYKFLRRKFAEGARGRMGATRVCSDRHDFDVYLAKRNATVV